MRSARIIGTLLMMAAGPVCAAVGPGHAFLLFCVGLVPYSVARIAQG